MRAFARDLDLDSGQLSNVFQGKKNISLVSAATLARKLTDHPLKSQLFYNLVEYSLAKNEEIKLELQKKISKLTSEKLERDSNIDDEEFKTISSWYHLPLIQVAFKKAVSAQEAADYLGISLGNAKLALERLTRLGFIEKSSGAYRRIKSLATTTDVPSLAIRQFHMQMMEKASRALFTQPTSKRNFSSVSLHVPTEHLNDFKKIINEAEDKLIELSRKYDADASTEVYHFSSQLFSLKEGEPNV
jgi:uncharacterized protein (TIGR02147 family)